MKLLAVTRHALSPIACAVALSLAMSATARAGDCPPDQRRPAGSGQPITAAAQGVRTRSSTIALADEPVKIGGRQLRARRLDIAPGGIVPWHSHADRPALLFVSQGGLPNTRAPARRRSSTRRATSPPSAIRRRTGGRTTRPSRSSSTRSTSSTSRTGTAST